MPVVTVNDHEMYYEIHGEGEPLVCMGGWGTYCHGGVRNLARGLTDQYQVLIVDYRGVGESTDDLSVEPTMALYAKDVIDLVDHLGWTNVHFVGLVGMGACISQEVALARPELVRSMVNMGSWAYCDEFLADQLKFFRDVHGQMGFFEFQKFVVLMSFLPEYYEQYKDKLLGPQGPWSELNGRTEAHARLVEACLHHDVRDRLQDIKCPTLIVHAGQDMVTGPRTTLPLEEGIPGAEGVMMEEVAHVVAGKEQKIAFCDILFDFLNRH
ncbi:MAG: alpha/beta hydrolase [Gammaproteobacteria bacterium]|nr:alpha/beta hydrolase [Gammaproteobacteria bacterium]